MCITYYFSTAKVVNANAPECYFIRTLAALLTDVGGRDTAQKSAVSLLECYFIGTLAALLTDVGGRDTAQKSAVSLLEQTFLERVSSSICAPYWCMQNVVIGRCGRAVNTPFLYPVGERL